MSLDAIRTKLLETTPELELEESWVDVVAALVVTLNGGDIHIDLRRRRNPGDPSNKTHIDLTSGGVGLSPVTDFFSIRPNSAAILPTRLNRANLRSLNAPNIPAGTDAWLPYAIRIKRLADRNAGANPSAQLTDKNDILPLRHALDRGHSLILLRKRDGSMDALGTHRDVSAIMGGKSKRMFRNEAVPLTAPPLVTVDSEEVSTSEIELGRPRTRQPSTGQGRFADREQQALVEERGMLVAREGLETAGFTVEDVHTPALASACGLPPYPGYDLRGTTGLRRRLLEVKGTTSAGQTILLSANELNAALENPEDVVLAVVSGITLQDDPRAALGGTLRLYKWRDVGAIREITERLTNAASEMYELGLSLQKHSMKWAVRIDSRHLQEIEIRRL